MSRKIEYLHVESGPDGLLRIAVFYDDGSEPSWLPGVGRAHGTPVFPVVAAAVGATPDVKSDGEGLWWESKTDAAKACAAARKAAGL